jgi:hypothetical protein
MMNKEREMSVVKQLEIVRERVEALTSALIVLNSMVDTKTVGIEEFVQQLQDFVYELAEDLALQD